MTPPLEHAVMMVEMKQEMLGYNKGQKVSLGPPVPPAPKGSIPKNSPEVKMVSPDDPIVITRGGAAAGMALHKGEGVFPKDGNAIFESCVEGLFAAGDSLASMLGGTQYPGLGFSSSASCVQGTRAGVQAAEYVKALSHTPIDEQIIEQNKRAIFAPCNRDKGFEPRWIIQQLQNTMIPFYVLHVKEEQRLNSALNTIRYLSENLVPKMKAADAHELKLAHETKNMLFNAEMRLKASLFRKESRGTHYREDYPDINSEEWTAWVVIARGEDGDMQLRKHPVQQPV